MSALCQTQPVLASSTINPPQETAEHISQAGGTSEKTCLRKGRKHCTEKGGGNKKSDKQERKYQGQRRRSCSVAEYISTAPWRGLVLEQLDIPQGAVAHGDPMLEQRKSLRRKEWQRNGYVLTITTPPPKKPIPNVRLRVMRAVWREGP